MKGLIYKIRYRGNEFLRAARVRKFLGAIIRQQGAADAKAAKAERTVVIGNISGNLFYVFFDVLLGFYFACRGFRVSVLVDDGYLLHFDSDKRREVLNLKPKFSNGYWFKRDFSRRFRLFRWAGLNGVPGVRLLTYSELGLDLTEADFDSQWAAFQEGQSPYYFQSSIKRYFGGRNYDASNPEHLIYARTLIANHWIQKKVALALFQQLNPQLFICVDGIYITRGTLLQDLKKLGVACKIYLPNGFQDRCIYIGEQPFEINHQGPHWDDYLREKYNSAWEEKGHKFIAARVARVSSPDSPEEKAFFDHLQSVRKNYSRVIGVFPNLPWDGAIPERDLHFKGMEDWLVSLVQWAESQNILLVIREHPCPPEHYNPYESSWDLLREYQPSVQRLSNVLYIKATDRISSYKLITRHMDLSTAYNGSLIFESAFLQKPMLIAANSPFTGKGVGIEAQSRDDYFRLLQSWNHANHQEFVQNAEVHAIRAASFSFVDQSFFFPIAPARGGEFNSYERYWQSWAPQSADYDPQKNPELKRTIERFLVMTDHQSTLRAAQNTGSDAVRLL